MKLILSLLAASCLLRADFDAQRWQFRRAIQVEKAASVSAFVADALIYRDSRAHLRDLRIIHADLELPYRLQVLSGSHEEVELRPTLLNKAALPHAGIQAVLDLNGHPQHNQVRIATGQRNFKEVVRVETSDNERDWALVLKDGIIFNVSREDRNVSELTLEYPLSTRRYLRLTIPGWDDPAYLQSTWLICRKQTDAVRDVMATLAPVVTEDFKTKTTSLVADVGFEGLPYDSLEVSIKSGLFFRDVEVLVSSDAKEWLFAGNGVLLRTTERTQLTVEIPEKWNRYVKLIIHNGDDPPLTAGQVVLRGLRRVVQFPSIAAGSYWLYSGNAAAKEPSYDFARIVPMSFQETAAALGKPENNPQYQAPTLPWTDRYPHLLYTVLIGSVVTMGYITWRFLMRIRIAQTK